MKVCKWAGDVNDEYCKGCDGINMIVDDKSVPCTECAGYEEGDEVVEETTNNNFMPEPEEDLPFEEEKNPEKKTVEDKAKNKPKSNENKKTNNNTPDEVSSKSDVKKTTTTKKTDTTKISEEKKSVENTIENSTGTIKVVSMRYTSGATIKKGDNYFKFIAEEEWDVSQISDSAIQDTREMLWAKLNAEIDGQIEDLSNLK